MIHVQTIKIAKDYCLKGLSLNLLQQSSSSAELGNTPTREIAQVKVDEVDIFAASRHHWIGSPGHSTIISILNYDFHVKEWGFVPD